MSKRVIIYHADCADGFTAAWAAAGGNESVELVPACYGDAPPDVTGKCVTIVDFSYPRETLIDMHSKADGLHVYDHHKTARATLEGLDFCTFDMERSGARLAWDYMRPHDPVPAFVRYVEDRDLWRWSLPQSREINAWIATQEKTIANWTALARDLENDFDRCVSFGVGALAQINAYVREQVSKAGRTWIGTYKVPCINATFAISELANALAAQEGVPFACTWFERTDGMVVCSLRSAKGRADVSEIAKLYGGGGHANAAGFTISRMEWTP